MRFHWQNLNEQHVAPGVEPVLGPPTNARAWLYFGAPGEDNLQPVAKVQYVLGDPWHLSAQVSFDDAGHLNWSVCVPFLQMYFGLEGVLPDRPPLVSEELALGVRVFDWAIWWDVLHPTMRWDSKTPRWRHGSLRLLDLLLGEAAYSERVFMTQRTTVPMPEGEYPCTVTLLECKWRRPRWVTERVIRAKVELDKPIPFSGKGENSWDCGEDGLHSHTTAARTIPAAVAAVVRSALETRVRRGDEWKWPVAPVAEETRH